MVMKRIFKMSVMITVIACGVLYGQRALVSSNTAAVAAASLSQFADSAEGSGDALESTIEGNRLEIGPVAGLTTAWHRSPAQSAIPLGSTVQFRVFLEPGTPMTWIGAVEVYRDKNKSVASCEFHRIGPAIVRAEVDDAQDGSSLLESVFDVVETAAADITIRSPQVWVNPVVIDENLPEDELNQQTVSYYGGESIAVLRDLGNGQYRTSTRRRVYMRTKADPAGFEPLIEWRLDGEAQALGGSHSEVFVGNATLHDVAVGPTGNPAKIEIEIYRVVITGHVPEGDIVPEGVPVTYTAVTVPPGYEEDITWLASTKYGTGVPILGSGPTFTTQFDDTFGPHPDGGLWQWLGVKGDNASAGQDQKPGICCLIPDPCQGPVTSNECMELGGTFLVGEEFCAEELCEQVTEMRCLYDVTAVVDSTCTEGADTIPAALVEGTKWISTDPVVDCVSDDDCDDPIRRCFDASGDCATFTRIGCQATAVTREIPGTLTDECP